MKILIPNVFHHLIFLKIYPTLSFYQQHRLSVLPKVVKIYLQLQGTSKDVDIFYVITLVYSYKSLYHHLHVDYYVKEYSNTFIFRDLSFL